MPSLLTDDGARLHYELSGHERGKPPLIFIHGWCGNLHHWDAQVSAFADSHRVLRMDRRGMGRSTTPGSDHSAERHAADVAALVRHVGLRDAVVIAHAGGGPVGVNFCAQYGELARAFVMIDSAIMRGFDVAQPSTRAGQFYADLIARLTAADRDAAFRAIYASYFGAQADAALVDAIVDAACATAPAVRVAEIHLMTVDTATPAMRMTQPTLVIAGPWLALESPPAVDLARLQGYFRQLEFARAIGTGHFVQLEAPEQTNAFIRSFVTRLP